MIDSPVALVTGAARGIGAATVRHLVEQGYRVVALDSCVGADPALPYPLATAADLADVVGPLGHSARAVVADVRDTGALREAVAGAVQTWGRLDVAVAAAGVITGGHPLWEADEADLQHLWDIDALGVWRTAAAAIPAMLAGPDPTRGRFVAVASAAAHRGLFHLGGYVMAKHAVAGLVRALAADLVGTGVTACGVSPGATTTTMLGATAAIYDVEPTDLVAHQALRRALTPEELAATIGFACSSAGASLHGTIVEATGGFG